MLNVRHQPEVHGQVGWAEVQEVEEAEPQRHAGVTQHLQPVPLAALLGVPPRVRVSPPAWIWSVPAEAARWAGISCFLSPAHFFIIFIRILLDDRLSKYNPLVERLLGCFLIFIGYKIVVQKFSSDITLYKSKSNFQHKHQNDHIDWN